MQQGRTAMALLHHFFKKRTKVRWSSPMTMPHESIQADQGKMFLAPSASNSLALPAVLGPEAAIHLQRMFRDPRVLEPDERASLIARLREAVELTPHVPEIRVLLGMALCVDLQAQEAMEQLREAVKQAPDSFIARLKFGELLMRLRICDQAARTYHGGSASGRECRAVRSGPPPGDHHSHHAPGRRRTRRIRQPSCQADSTPPQIKETGHPTRSGRFQVGEDARNSAIGAVDRHTSSRKQACGFALHALWYSRDSRGTSGWCCRRSRRIRSDAPQHFPGRPRPQRRS